MSKTTLWVQKWEESEAGWGTRPDGYTLHKSREDIEKFLQDMRAREAEVYKGAAPSEYSRPWGEPYETATEDPGLIGKVLASANGIWGPNGNRYPEPTQPGADRTGWV